MRSLKASRAGLAALLFLQFAVPAVVLATPAAGRYIQRPFKPNKQDALPHHW
jgi:hypothetical protein